ncbi:Ethylene-responsive transcription factor 12 [Capsicum baccatum]|uniref:Ethylene-responsive transcription factor 12 n=1 Tax=Capsicum baccatum TaxID=33114 RepID=A0A2G2WX84_CAPBA|nr:Ethylene-responsive transcription factor 12 [Capsicum baccatum]
MVSKNQKCRKVDTRVEKANGGVEKEAKKVKGVPEKVHYREVQKRSSGKYTAETENPRKRFNVLLGMFDMTEEEAQA